MLNNNPQKQPAILIVAIDQQNNSSQAIAEICQFLNQQQKSFQVFEQSSDGQKITDSQTTLLDSSNEIWQEKCQQIFSKAENFSALKLLQDAKNLSTNPQTQSLIDLEIKAYEKNPQQFDKLVIEDFSILENALLNEGKSHQLANDFKIKNQAQGIAILHLNQENIASFTDSLEGFDKPIILANPAPLPATDLQQPSQIRLAYDSIHERALQSKGEFFRYDHNQQGNIKLFQEISQKLSPQSQQAQGNKPSQHLSWREKISSPIAPKNNGSQLA